MGLNKMILHADPIVKLSRWKKHQSNKVKVKLKISKLNIAGKNSRPQSQQKRKQKLPKN